MYIYKYFLPIVSVYFTVPTCCSTKICYARDDTTLGWHGISRHGVLHRITRIDARHYRYQSPEPWALKSMHDTVPLRIGKLPGL